MKSLTTICALFSVIICVSSCSWGYKAHLESKTSGEEQVSFTLSGYDLLYGEPVPSTWYIDYPRSARNPLTNKIAAEDINQFTGDKYANKESLSGYMIVDPNSKVDVQLFRRMTRADGSSYEAELPFNGSYRISEQNNR